MKLLINTLLTGILLLALSGCGQKGPLYVPDEPERTSSERLEGYYKRY